jgi:hypothetical protein
MATSLQMLKLHDRVNAFEVEVQKFLQTWVNNNVVKGRRRKEIFCQKGPLGWYIPSEENELIDMPEAVKNLFESEAHMMFLIGQCFYDPMEHAAICPVDWILEQQKALRKDIVTALAADLKEDNMPVTLDTVDAWNPFGSHLFPSAELLKYIVK